MTRNGPLTDKNAPAASETDVSQPSKKQRLGDAQPADHSQCMNEPSSSTDESWSEHSWSIFLVLS